MKAILTFVALAICGVFIFSFSSCHYVRQGERAFYYDVSSGKAVNQADNPLLPMGFNGAWGVSRLPRRR